MKFSIITVCKDSEKTIEKTILSVLEQSYKNYEYLIIDGDSKDGTLDIANKYSDEIFKIISEPDNGLYNAMNKGIQNASGDYLFFLNSDDCFIEKTVLQKVFEKTRYNQQELLYGDQAYITNDLNKISIRKHNKLNKIYLLKNTPCQPATFYRKDSFEKYGNFDESYKIVSDHEWFLRVFLKHNISCYYLGFPITLFNTGGLSTSSKRENLLDTERNRMLEKYFTFQERKRLEFLSKYLRCLTTLPVIKNILNPFFNFKLILK